MLPLVTVVTPAYNRADYLEETIQSVLSQDYPRIEYIVLDDGSTDDTPEILARYEGRIIWESHPNMGETRTVNRGWALAHGDFIVTVNSDDPLLPGAVSAAVSFMMERPEIMLGYPDWNGIGPTSEILARYQAVEYDYLFMVRHHYCLVGPGAMMRRQVLDLAGMRDPEFRYVADFEHLLRIGLKARLCRIPRTLATHRLHPGQATSSMRGTAMAWEHIRMMEKYFSLPDLPASVLAVRKEALGSAHLHAAIISGSDRSSERFHSMKSLLYYAACPRSADRKRLEKACALLLPPRLRGIVERIIRGVEAPSPGH
jgi:GT2 family glycosyltransferase